MFLVTKFVDAFTDTAMGRIIDTHTDKNGDRFRSVDPSDGNPGRSGKRVDLQYFYRRLADVGKDRICNGRISDIRFCLLYRNQYPVWRNV